MATALRREGDGKREGWRRRADAGHHIGPYQPGSRLGRPFAPHTGLAPLCPRAGRGVDGRAKPDEATGRAKEIEHANDFDLCRRGIAFRRVCGVWPQAGRLAAAAHGADGDGPVRVPAAAWRLPAAAWRLPAADGDLPAAHRPAGLCPACRGSDRGPAGSGRADGRPGPCRLLSARTTCPCGTHHCNTQYGKCAFPCQTSTDCITPNACMMGLCVPQMPQAAPAH